ncbi:epoxide hydrolase [Tsukamurella tyrosinosolvens]|mgnify:CR=1 FL=1|uniref:Pimeloyl-ACP methyl ester carboxylesterase n=1 Tax=Tsukamurella tyrosinosolvens TaxID=57704 RepID=A0A1H4SFP3_TSUTY|nr:epoxide hydrolase family protein [Tsukamurella tyrosinosolvens]KXO93477.1 hypothetical protein AXK58_16775 [Tsukamurella tyrosinosolvens]KXP05754.1 hypothetical protein AXK59_09585 [Tsukamurella tyrosinosolvens]KZL95573.1 hypothetical protein AXX05_20610 [Tsukamurella tyrosinosolvens]MCA4993642.1 epoxide hydrolase [Tsukamurella tyrosinosolvens]QRY83042.1 epoxide hydrolase [Tsukamurella tyrosinosolvens]
MTVSPFTIAVPDAEIALLRERLRATRFPDVAPNTDFARGTSGEYLRELVAYWAGEFDWREAEAGLNAIPQFVAEVDGRPVHFLHRVAADARGAILLLHGWPDTPFRYRRVLDDLTARGFDCVVPSLPGFAFTGGHALSSAATADLFQRLMTETLGYDTFVVAGGDVGTVVGSQLARRHADRVTALHLTNAEYPTGSEPDLTDEERAYAEFIQYWWATQGGYAAVQSTKPQIVGPALNDSPAGLAAWMLGLIDTGAQDHDVEGAFGGRDELLTNISIYWFTQTAATAADSYAADGWGGELARITVPTAMAIYPREAQSPRAWCERAANVVRYTAMPRGGHFAALEVPQDYAGDLIAFLDEPA